jgi:hypothetical protein
MVGSAVAVGERSEDGFKKRQELPWQSRALRVVDLIPELDYVSRFYARILAQLRIFPAKREPNGDLTEIKTGLPVDLLNRIRDIGGGHSDILYDYGRLYFITGEGNLFGYDLDTDDETWIFVWNDELKVERSGDNTIKKITWTPSSANDPREFTSDQAVVYKFWKSHPRRRGEATSPMRAIVEGNIAEELIALTQSVRSTATTRATRGILIIPQEIQPPAADTEGDEDPNVSPWIIQIAEHLEAQVEQAGSPAAATPYLMEVPFEYAEAIRLVELHNPQHDYLEKDLREEAVQRIARGVDFPSEALTGIGSTNHWAALQILMDMWRSHGAPVAQGFCNELTSVYLRPALRDAEYADWRDIVVGYDASAVTVKPDRSDDAKTALTLNAIGPSGYRKMLSIPEDYAPTAAEKAQLKEANQAAQPRDRNQAVDQTDGPAPPGPEGDSGRKSRATANGRPLGVVELAIMRCRELAGIRIKQRAQRSFPDRLEFIESLPFGDIAAVMGVETLRELGVSNTLGLVTGGADNLRSLLKVWGYSKDQADLFGEVVEVHAARTLYGLDFPDVDEHFASLVAQLEAA